VLNLSGSPLWGVIDFFRPGIWWKALMSCIFAEVESSPQTLVLQPLKTLNYETFFYRASDACSGDESTVFFHEILCVLSYCDICEVIVMIE